jgi:hypothetical protein
MSANIHVAIFIIGFEICVLAVDAIYPAKQPNVRNGFHKFAELNKKRARKIKLSPIACRIKVVRIEAIAAIDSERLVG